MRKQNLRQAFFINQHRYKDAGKQSFYKLLKRLCASECRAELPISGLHHLRHSIATHLHSRRALPVEQVQGLFGT